MEFVIRPQFLAPNGYLHAASIIALADTAGGLCNDCASAGRRVELHDDRVEIEFPEHCDRRNVTCRRQRCAPGPHDTGVGCDRDACRKRQDDRIVSLHADDSVAEGEE